MCKKFPAYHDGKKNNLSLISSAPLQVCLCDNEGIMCLSYSTFSLYPGETLELHAFTVSQPCGTVKGTVKNMHSKNHIPLAVSGISILHLWDIHEYHS